MTKLTERYYVYISVGKDVSFCRLSDYLQEVSEMVNIYPAQYLRCQNGYILSFWRDPKKCLGYIYQNKMFQFVQSVSSKSKDISSQNIVVTMRAESNVRVEEEKLPAEISCYMQSMKVTKKVSSMLKKQQEDFNVIPKERKKRRTAKEMKQEADKIAVVIDNFLLEGQYSFHF